MCLVLVFVLVLVLLMFFVLVMSMGMVLGGVFSWGEIVKRKRGRFWKYVGNEFGGVVLVVGGMFVNM